MSFPDTFLSSDFAIRVAMGLVSGWSRVTALGHNPSLDSTTIPEDIWTQGGIYPWLTAGTLVKVRSSSAEDAPGGLGCQSISLNGLDDPTFAARTQSITLNGTTDVLVPIAILRCNGLVGILPGVANAICTNVGDITLRKQSDDSVIAVIPAGKGISQQSQFTTPLGRVLVILGLEGALTALSGTTSRTIDVDTYFKAPGQIYRLPRRIYATEGGPTNLEPRTCIIVPEKNDFQLRCTAVSSTSNTSVNGAFEALLGPKPTA